MINENNSEKQSNSIRDNQYNISSYHKEKTRPRKTIKITLINHRADSVTIRISNTDLFFTEKLIKHNISIKNLKYKLHIHLVDNIDRVIKTKFIPSHTREQNSKTFYINFLFDNIVQELKSMYHFNKSNLYKIKVELIESFSTENLHFIYNIPEKILSDSDFIYINNNYGVIDDNIINNLHKNIYGKKLLSKSEKDAIKAVKDELECRELEHVLNEKEIKNFTFECRNYEDINTFVDSKYKFSKNMDDKRQKKVLYATNSKLFFDDKMMMNDVDLKNNRFMKNEWFMGPVYSYDANYKKFK